jgi:hypothetical protein
MMDEQEARETLDTGNRLFEMIDAGELDRRYVDWDRLTADMRQAYTVIYGTPPQQTRSAAGRVVLVSNRLAM